MSLRMRERMCVRSNDVIILLTLVLCAFVITWKSMEGSSLSGSLINTLRKHTCKDTSTQAGPIDAVSFHTLCSQSSPLQRQQNTDRQQIRIVRRRKVDGQTIRETRRCEKQGTNGELNPNKGVCGGKMKPVLLGGRGRFGFWQALVCVCVCSTWRVND